MRLLLFVGADPFAEDEYSCNALNYALRRGVNGPAASNRCLHHNYGSGDTATRNMVNDLIEAMSQPQPLTRLCRTVIRRWVLFGWDMLTFELFLNLKRQAILNVYWCNLSNMLKACLKT